MPSERQPPNSDNESVASNNPGFDLFESDSNNDLESVTNEIVLPPSDNEDDTNVLPYCTIIVDSKGGWPCEKAWYSKCLYLMVCNEIEKGLHHPLVETFVIYIFFILDL